MKKKAFIYISILLGIAVGLIAAEAAARLFMPTPLYFARNEGGRGGARTFNGTLLWEVEMPRYSREELRAFAKDGGAFRIMGVGDSVMYGSGVQAEDTYMGGLARRVTAISGRAARAINLAQPGFNLEQKAALFLERRKELSPDLLILQIWEDDLSSYLVVGGVVYEGDASSGGKALWSIPLPRRLNDSLIVHSRLYQLLSLDAMSLRMTRGLMERRNIEGARERRRKVFGALDAMYAGARASGTEMLILLSPDLGKGDVHSSAGSEGESEIYPAVAAWARGRPHVEVLDLGVCLGGRKGGDIGVDKVHFNKAGHRLVLDAMAAFIAKTYLSGNKLKN